MRAERPILRRAAATLLALALLPMGLPPGLPMAQAQTRARPSATEPLPLPPPPAPPASLAPQPAQPGIVPREAPRDAPRAGPPLQRRIGLAELGPAAGLPFDQRGVTLTVPLPRNQPGLAGRLALAIDLAAPFGGRHAVELRAEGRLLESRAFSDAPGPLAIEMPLPEDLLAQPDGALSIELRLVGDPDPASASLRPDSHLTLLLPDPAELSVAALFRLLPQATQVLLRPGPISPAEATAALQIGLALAATGREVSIASAPPGRALPGPGGTRIWASGAVLVGLGAEAAAVRMLDGVPVLTLGGPSPERMARLLDSPLREAALMGAVSGGTEGAAASSATATLPFAALSGSTAPQEAARAEWTLSFSTRDLPPGTRLEALEVALRAAPDPGGARAVGTVLLNNEILGAATLSAEGSARLVLPVQASALAAENTLSVVVNRAAASGPAQLLPSSLLRLAPAGPPRDFLDLPSAFGAGVEVLVDAPGRVLVAEGLNPLLWVMRAVVPAAAPLRVTLAEPGTPAAPSGPFVAATIEPPADSDPLLRFDAGRILLSNREGRPVLELGGLHRLIAAQLLTAGGHPGLWLRHVGPVPLLPAAAPRLGQGDIALLDGQGVALAWSSGPAPALRIAYPEAPRPEGMSLAGATAWLAALRPWRSWIIGVAWVAGFLLVVYAFLRPRRDPPPAPPAGISAP
ncbi:hypothetical protein [Falsiroseomonas tokyonensis]|uniref:Cellulose synthase regulatory subunit n=1 Tax=Falsiroseomonas tokyonensis TaxID=430521 RepID=A0ABV7BR41_9PROT|nr:hypothetical protein [Falsiroseomonas tokyonensis]MBU8537492.1 hypothetical protein [Falsiroseomonas tokyonensis]